MPPKAAPAVESGIFLYTPPTKYEYDPQDNLTKVTDPKNLTTLYIYNGFNELISQTSPDTGTSSYTYDTAGNMLTKTDARGITATYRYDPLNRISGINTPAYQADPVLRPSPFHGERGCFIPQISRGFRAIRR